MTYEIGSPEISFIAPEKDSPRRLVRSKARIIYDFRIILSSEVIVYIYLQIRSPGLYLKQFNSFSYTVEWTLLNLSNYSSGDC
jgi:hypothetical protein